MPWIYRTGLGQDHHRFAQENPEDSLICLAGRRFPGPRLEGNSDADVVLHAICNAVSSLSGVNFLGPPADDLCLRGVTDSEIYLKHTLEDLRRVRPRAELVHLAVSIEGKRPRLWDHIPAMRANLAELLDLDVSDVGLTATTGEGLTGMGQGEGLACLALLTIREPDEAAETRPES